MLSWIGRGVVVLLVLALASAAAMTSPDPASAQTEAPPYESLRSGNTGYLDDFYKKVLHDSERSSSWHNQVTGSNAGKNVIYKQATKARIAARLLPAFGTFATRATLVGSGAYLGWTIYQNFSGTDDDEVDMWLDHPALGANTLFNPCAAPPGGNCTVGDPNDLPNTNQMGWKSTYTSLPGSNCNNSGTGIAFLSGYKCEVGAAWVLSYSANNANGGCFTSISGVSPPCWVLHLSPIGYTTRGDARDGTWDTTGCGATTGTGPQSSCNVMWSDADAAGLLSTFFPNESQAGWDSQWPRQLGFAIEQTQNAILADVPGAASVITHTHIIGASAVKRRAVILTTGAMQGLTDDPLDDPAGTPTQTYTYTVPGPYTGPDTVGTSSDTQNALDEFDSPCGRSFINWVLEPGTYTFNPDSCGGWNPATETFPLLQPLVNETYTAYLARLQGLGWLGSYTATETLAGQEVPAMGPEGVVSVRVGQNLYRVGAWPSPAPAWNVNVSIQLRYNPASVPTAPGGGEVLPPGEGGVGLPPLPTGPLGEWCPSCPPVDFGPLTDSDFGGTFPFGVISWVGGVVGSLTATAEAPVFDFDVEFVEENYVVDLEVLDPYMDAVRTLLSWCIWIGAVWWFGSRLLGFRETGDPGQAVDDAW